MKPTLSVPGISSSGTSRNSLKSAVVGAYEPMPRVSKNEVTKPTVMSPACGLPGIGRGPRIQTIASATPAATKAASSAILIESTRSVLRDQDGARRSGSEHGSNGNADRLFACSADADRLERGTIEAVDGPVVDRLGAERLVKADRAPVPVEH